MIDRETPLARFEWVETADHPRFKAISALVLGRAEPGGPSAAEVDPIV